jgi:hypothetical protein
MMPYTYPKNLQRRKAYSFMDSTLEGAVVE